MPVLTRSHLHYGFRIAILQDEHYEHQVQQWLDQLDVINPGFEAKWRLDEKIDYTRYCISNHIQPMANAQRVKVDFILNDPTPVGRNVTIVMATICSNHEGIAHSLSQKWTRTVLQLIKETLKLPEETEPMWYYDLTNVLVQSLSVSRICADVTYSPHGYKRVHNFPPFNEEGHGHGT